MAFIQLGAPSNFGSETSPMIGLIFAYEKKRSGADMQYRFQITVKAVSGSSYFGYNIVCTPTIAGSKKAAITLKANSPSQWTSNIVYTSSWYTVKNKTTGTTAISFAMSSNASGRSQTFSYSMAIDPAASSFSVNNGTLGSAQNITVTKNNSAFTSTITYKCGSASGTIVDKSTDTIIPWTPPINLANQNTTGTSLSCVLTFTTYSGNNVVGTSSKTITLAIPSSIVPTVSLSVTDGTNNLTQFGAYVQGKSTIKVSILANGAGGSSISKCSTSANGGTYTSADFTTGVIIGSGTLTISVTVTDSRGRTASASKKITVLAYTRPKVSALSVIRCNQSGVADTDGAYLKATFSAEITALNNKNTKTYQLQYKKKSESSYTTVTLSSYADAYSVVNGTHVFAAETNSSYDVILKASDYFTSASLSAVGPAIAKIWSIFKKGLGFAIGKVAELSNTFEVGWKSVFHKSVEVKENVSVGNYVDRSTLVSGGIKIHDLRDVPVKPGMFGSNVMNMYFDTTSADDGRWKSIMSLTGWAEDTYATHELAFDAHNSSVTPKLFHRTGLSGAFGSWQQLANISDLAWNNVTGKPTTFPVADSGWVNCTLNSNFQRFDSTGNYATLQVRKIANIVHLRGTVKNISAFTPTADGSHVVCTVPNGYRPAYKMSVVMQGSGSNRFCSSVYANGEVSIHRYSNNTTMQNQIPAGAFLNFEMSWVV